MSIETTLARVEAIRAALADPAEMVGSTGGVEAPAATGQPTFATALKQAGAAGEAGEGYGANGVLPASATSGVGALRPAGGAGGTGERIVSIAESQLGQTEQPPGSNESPAIAEYRSATSGAIPGAPWCAYFASWVARQAGVPLGANGEGLGAVSQIWSWAQSTGRAVANGPGVTPHPGDLIVFGDEHVGIVKGVLPNGSIQTIEGNYENKVAANVRSASEATGYVRMS